MKAPLSPGTWPSWLGALLLSGVWLLPAGWRNTLGRVLGRTYARRDTRSRRTALVNLQACFPDLDAQQRQDLYEQHQVALLQSVFVMPRLWWGTRGSLLSHVEFEGLEHVTAARQSGQSVVLLITHTVGLDVGMITLSSQFPMHGIYKPFPNPVVEWLVHRGRGRFGGVPVARGAGLRTVIKGLRDGKMLCYLSDEDLGPNGSVFAPFFDHQKATLAMLPRIVASTDACVVPMVTEFLPATDSFRVHLLPPLNDYPTGDAIEDATNMNKAIESTIRMMPEQFLWKLRIFRTSPDGGDSRYRQIERGDLQAGEL